MAAGQGEAASDVAQELLAEWLDRARGHSLASFWVADLTFALVELGRGDELMDATSRTPTQTRWLEAAQGACSGDWRRAASTFSRIGSLPDEALARLRAAADLEAADAPEEAEDERRRASAFYREVEAVSYVAAVE